MRPIDANALSDEVDKSKHNNPHDPGIVRVNHRNEHDHFLRMIYDAPTVDAVEVVHGRWENITGGMITLGDCSECKVRQPVIGTNYCKNCGAKMDGDGNDGMVADADNGRKLYCDGGGGGDPGRWPGVAVRMDRREG